MSNISVGLKRSNKLSVGASKGTFRKNGTLRPREWEQFDTKIIDVTRQEAKAVGYIEGKGLTVQGSFGKTISTYARMSDVDTVTASMTPGANMEKDAQEFDEIGVNVPLLSGSFDIDDRTLEASRNWGESLDTTAAAALTKNIWITANEILFNGWKPSLGNGNPVYGFTNRPGALTGSITANSWNGTTTTGYGATIDKEFNAHIKSLAQKYYHGPFAVWVSNNIYTPLQRPFSEQYGGVTVMQHLMAYPQVEAVMNSDQLADNTVVIVQMTDDVVDIYKGLDMTPTPIEFQCAPMVSEYYLAYAFAPRVKVNYKDETGILVATG